MKQLVVGLQQRLSTASGSTSVAVADHMKSKAQELIFDAVIGHQMVEASLENEYKASERDFQASYEAVVHSLRSGAAGSDKRPCNNQSEGRSAIEELVVSLCSGAKLDEMLQLEIRDLFQQMQDSLTEDLAAYERDFRLLASQDDAAGSMEAASSTRGGWSTEDDEKFLIVLKNYERRSGIHKKHELLYDQVKAVLPHRERLEIKKHVKFHTHLRFYQEKCRDRQADYDRKLAELQTRAKERIREAIEQDDERKRKRQQLQQLQQQCAYLHEKVSDWRVTKDAEQRIKDQQGELERLLLEQQTEANNSRWKKRHEDQKAQVQDFRSSKLVESFVEEMHAQQQREKDELEKAVQSAVNAERVQFRQDELEVCGQRHTIRWTG
jgi:hypothetical protein